MIKIRVLESIEEIEAIYYSLGPVKFKQKKKTVLELLKENETWNYSSLAKRLVVERRTIKKWVDKYKNEGILAYFKYYKERDESSRVVTEDIRKEIKKLALSDPDISCKKLCYDIGKKLKKHRNYHTIFRILNIYRNEII